MTDILKKCFVPMKKVIVFIKIMAVYVQPVMFIKNTIFIRWTIARIPAEFKTKRGSFATLPFKD